MTDELTPATLPQAPAALTPSGRSELHFPFGNAAPKVTAQSLSAFAQPLELIQAQRTVAAAIHSMAGLSVTYCPSRLARYLADSSHGAQSMCGRWPVCFAVGADASPLAVAPPQSPLWLTGKAKTRASLPVRGGNLGALLRVDRQPISGLQVNIVPTVPANGTLIIYPVVVLRTHGKQFSWYPRAR